MRTIFYAIAASAAVLLPTLTTAAEEPAAKDARMNDPAVIMACVYQKGSTQSGSRSCEWKYLAGPTITEDCRTVELTLEMCNTFLGSVEIQAMLARMLTPGDQVVEFRCELSEEMSA